MIRRSHVAQTNSLARRLSVAGSIIAAAIESRLLRERWPYDGSALLCMSQTRAGRASRAGGSDLRVGRWVQAKSCTRQKGVCDSARWPSLLPSTNVLAGLFQLVLPMTRQEWASENRLWVIGVKEFLFLCKLTEHYRAQYSVCYKVLRTRHFLQTTENISSSKQPHNTKSCRINVHYIFCPHVSFEIKRDTPSRCKLWSTWKFDETWISATLTKSLAPYIYSWSEINVKLTGS